MREAYPVCGLYKSSFMATFHIKIRSKIIFVKPNFNIKNTILILNSKGDECHTTLQQISTYLSLPLKEYFKDVNSFLYIYKSFHQNSIYDTISAYFSISLKLNVRKSKTNFPQSIRAKNELF